MMEQLATLAADPAAWVALATLITMEVVLGIDNLIFIAILMQVAEAYAKRRGFRTREDFNAKDAWIIGAGQCIALIPGSSRSGSTLMTALFRRVPHDYAARFSFVMSIPAITAPMPSLVEVVRATSARPQASRDA